MHNDLKRRRALRAAVGAAVITCVSASSAVAAWEPADYFWTPARVTYCEMLRNVTDTPAGNRLACSVDDDRDSRGYTTIYTLGARGRVVRSTSQGQGGVGFASLRYDRWYSMSGGAVKRGKAPGAVRCIVRRSTGLRCVNPAGHGFVLTKERQRTF